MNEDDSGYQHSVCSENSKSSPITKASPISLFEFPLLNLHRSVRGNFKFC